MSACSRLNLPAEPTSGSFTPGLLYARIDLQLFYLEFLPKRSSLKWLLEERLKRETVGCCNSGASARHSHVMSCYVTLCHVVACRDEL